MSTTPGTPVEHAVPASSGPGHGRLPVRDIDASCRNVLLLAIISAVIWLCLASTLWLVCFVKLHAPGFLAGAAWLGFGRLMPAARNALLYGFASQAALGICLWTFCRLGGNTLSFPRLVLIGFCLWNLGLTFGFGAILAGFNTGFSWVDIPGSIAVILFCAAVLVALGAVVTFSLRREPVLYVSQWYMLAALFWWLWIYSAAYLLLVFWPVPGSVQSIVHAWFMNNFAWLWLTPVALGSIFYFIPKLLRRPLANWWLAVFAFWTLALFANWSGLTGLVAGPAPAWMTSASIAAQFMLVIPMIAAAMAWNDTSRGAYRHYRHDSTLRFIAFGLTGYIVWTVLAVLFSHREVAATTQFTYVTLGLMLLQTLGFAGMTFLGAIDYITPRLVHAPWPSRTAARLHWWCSAGGTVLLVASLLIGGLVQGVRLSHPEIPFVKVVRSTLPFVGMATLGWAVLLVGQAALLFNLIAILHRHTAEYRASALLVWREWQKPRERARS